MSSDKVKMAPIFRALSHDINSGKIGRYFVIEPESGERQVLKTQPNNTAVYSKPQAVEDALLKYLANTDLGRDYDLTPSQANQCVRYWMSVSDPIELPPNIAEKGDPKLCFHRLPFNYDDPVGETPIFDELLSRCTNTDAIRQFMGSLTVERSSTFQYLWIYGAGGEGKGSLGRALMRIFGGGAVTMAVPRTDGQKQFLAHSLQGKRLCIFPECSNFNFPNDPLFKQLTGGDHVWFEQKGKMGFSGVLNCKFIFFSNERTGVEGTDANTRRLIYSEVAKPTVKYSSSTYDGLLDSEVPDFIKKCRAYYLEKCPNGEDIEIRDARTLELLDANEERYEVLTAKWLKADHEGFITPARLREIQQLADITEIEYRHWIEYMRRRLGIESTIRDWNGNGHKSRRWVGVRELTETEYASWVLDKNSGVPETRENANVTRIRNSRKPW